jgi:hypothetical protein
MPTVEVTPKDESGNRFSVEVRDEDGSATTHEVTVDNSDWERLGSGYASRAELVEGSFKFLLEWEPKEDILASFDLGMISQYFPQYGESGLLRELQPLGLAEPESVRLPRVGHDE